MSASIPTLQHAAFKNYSADMPANALQFAAACWFAVAALGQLFFAIYVIGFYGRSAARDDLAAWKKVLTHGYVPGDTPGNVVLASHLLFAAVVMTGGALQLVPFVRQRWPRFHRWNGRVYLALVTVMSVGGFWMVWARGTVGDLSQYVAISVNALLIVGFAGMALREALARRFVVHRRWALRLFIVVGGVWFFRLALTLWIVVNQGPVGFDPESFTGPALTVIAFGQYLLPLAVLELYFRAQSSRYALASVAMAAGLGVLTLATAAGIATASMLLWLPQL